MSYWKILFSFFVLISCNETQKKTPVDKTSDVIAENYSGNAIVFFYPQRFGDKVYLFQSKEGDSLRFKNEYIEKCIKNNSSIQMRIGQMRMVDMISHDSKGIMAYKACNLPYDSMYYVKIFIRYKNFTEIPLDLGERKPQLSDSCRSILISTMKDNSGIDSFYIYSRN